MELHSVGDRVKLLRVDYPFNNAVGTVAGVRIAALRPGLEYRINFDGVEKDPNFHRDICVVADTEAKSAEARRAVAALVAATGHVLPPMVLSEDPKERKGMPITTGVLDYFPLAIAEVAKCSKAGNDQHNPGQPLHWAKDKSTDHADCIARHLIDRGSIDTDGIRHSAKLAWRALANLQIELENAKKET